MWPDQLIGEQHHVLPGDEDIEFALAHLRQQLLVLLDVGIHYRGVRKSLVRLQCRPSRVHAAQGVAGSVRAGRTE